MLFDKAHWAYAETVDTIETLIPFDPKVHASIDSSQIVTNENGKFVRQTTTKRRHGLRTFKDASLVGINVYRNVFSPVYMKRKDRSRHHYIIGKS